MSPEFAKRFLERIREQAGTLLPPASLEDIKQFEQTHWFRLPVVLREIFLESNGTDFDDNLNQLIPLEKLELVESDQFGWGIIFFEQCFKAKAWGFVIESGQVISYGSMPDYLVTDSLMEFFELYPNHQVF